MDGSTRIQLLNRVNFIINYMLPDLPIHFYSMWREKLVEIRDIIARAKDAEA